MEIKVEEKNNTAYAINSNNKSNNNISKFETILDMNQKKALKLLLQ
ncbi:hypothetical protein [Clostridium sp. YIM B02555]|nr:hypothetical protein [Clostridium sp. YIM B02555]